jgi:hypothetical protein
MIWVALPILALLILASLTKKQKKGSSGGGSRSGSKEEGKEEGKMDKIDLQRLILEANDKGGWKWKDKETNKVIILDKPPEEFGKFLGVYLGNDPRSDIPKTVMSLSEFAQIVKQTIGTSTTEKRVLVQSIIAIAIREQGAEGGLKFPDNNPFGFNAWKGGWQYIRDLISGIFLAKDRQSWKWFLSFASLNDAIRAIERALRRKGFHTIQSPKDFVNLYVRKWWSPSNREDEIQQIIQREKRNLIAVWNRAGRYVG